MVIIIIIFIQPPIDLVLTQITFEKRTNFDYVINIKIAQQNSKVILSFEDFTILIFL